MDYSLSVSFLFPASYLFSSLFFTLDSPSGPQQQDISLRGFRLASGPVNGLFSILLSFQIKSNVQERKGGSPRVRKRTYRPKIHGDHRKSEIRTLCSIAEARTNHQIDTNDIPSVYPATITSTEPHRCNCTRIFPLFTDWSYTKILVIGFCLCSYSLAKSSN